MVLQPMLCHLAFEITLYCWSGPENNLWFSIHSPGWAVSCYIREGRAPKCWPVPSLPHRLLLLLKGKNDSGSGFSQIFDPEPGPKDKRTILPETTPEYRSGPTSHIWKKTGCEIRYFLSLKQKTGYAGCLNLRYYVIFLCEQNFIGQQIFHASPWTRNCLNLYTHETHQPNLTNIQVVLKF